MSKPPFHSGFAPGFCDVMQYENVMKKIIIFIFTSSLISTLFGCKLATDELWEHSIYSEKFNHFLISSDQKQFIIIGKDYHYIFDNTPSIPTILNWSGRKKLQAKFYSFELDNKDRISGNILISCTCENVSNHDIEWLKNNDFELTENSKGKVLYQNKFNIEGTRYLSNGVTFEPSKSLNRKYYVTVKEPYSAAGIAIRTVATPVTVVRDGIFILGTTGMVLVALPFIALTE
jgi:hypothetical protein